MRQLVGIVREQPRGCMFEWNSTPLDWSAENTVKGGLEGDMEAFIALGGRNRVGRTWEKTEISISILQLFGRLKTLDCVATEQLSLVTWQL